MFDGHCPANYSYRGSQSAWVISRSVRSHLCVLAPVKRLTGVLNRQPGTEQRLLKSAERRSRPPGWVFREQTRATGGSRPSVCVSAHGGRMPGCTHVHSLSAKSDTSLCWRWNAGGTVRKRGRRWIDRTTPDLLSHSSPITSQSWTKTDVFTLFNLSNV